MQARVRRSKAPSGLEYHVLTPEGMARYLQSQTTAPDHLKDFFCLDQSKRSVSEYSPAVRTNAPSGKGIFVADSADPEDEKRCTTFNAIETMDQLLNSDRPILTIQVTRFSDATLITYCFNHLMGDIFTLKDIMKGWESSLHGTPPPPWEKLGTDPFGAYAPGGKLASKDINTSSPALPPGWRLFGLIDKARLISRLLWDMHYTRPEKTISQKYVFIPDAEIDRLVEEAKQDLLALEERLKKQGTPPNSPLKVSRSNVLYAWVMKHNHAALDPSATSSPVAIVGGRGRPPTGMTPNSDDFPPHNWYNASYLAVLGSLKVGDLISMPLGELALHVREGTATGSTPESAQQIISFGLHHGAWKGPASSKLAFWSPPDHCWSGLTDWRIATIADVDLTPARLDGTARTVATCGIQTQMATVGSLRNRWACLGDVAGGTWVFGFISDAEWRFPGGFGKYPHFQRPAKKPTSIDEFRGPL
jgi:hypothetical protein